MDEKKSCLVSSTPHPQKTRQSYTCFEEVVFSPIAEPSQSKIVPTIARSKPIRAQRTGAVRKRKVASKEKAAPESVTPDVIRELGEKVVAQDVCNNVLSHSRNLYNMFPEPRKINEKKSSLFSSTPHPQRNLQSYNCFEDDGVSPIAEPFQSKIVPSKARSKPIGTQRTEAIRKRKVASKEKAAPESVTADVLRELGEKAQDVCNNVLSHSRNLYNMFPEPIILDSDEEEKSIIAKKPMKKLKKESKIPQSTITKSKEEKKIKEHDPGSSSTTQLTQHAADKQLKKQTSVQSLNNVSLTSKNKKTRSCAKEQTKNKALISEENSPSVVILDDNDDDNLFPIYQPGCSIHQTSSKNKPKDKVRLSLELDEKFPIQWSGRQQKIGYDKENELSDVENIKEHEADEVEKNNNEKRTVNYRAVGKIKPKVLTGTVPKCINNKRIKDSHAPDGESELSSVLISRFENVKFHLNKYAGGKSAKCLKTDQNNIGYLEVGADEVFNGKSGKITFMVIEGNAKVVHQGMQQTLSPGDLIHIRDESGFQLESAGTDFVRFLYIKALVV